MNAETFQNKPLEMNILIFTTSPAICRSSVNTNLSPLFYLGLCFQGSREHAFSDPRFDLNMLRGPLILALVLVRGWMEVVHQTLSSVTLF